MSNTITASPEFREIERLRIKANHDEAQALQNAERKRSAEIARVMITDNEPIDRIARYTGLTPEEISSL